MTRDQLCFGLAGALVLLATAATALAQEGSECETDDDCAAGQECVVVGGSSPGCDPSRGPCDDLPPPTEFRECHGAPLYCERDDDCPTGLVCELDDPGEDCAVSSDGETFCPEPEPDAPSGECAFEFVQCEDDSECQANYECAPLGTQEDCSSPAIACAPGEDCQIPEPVCEVVDQIFACFPIFMACDVAEQCPAGWSCLDFALTEDGDPPPWWDVGDATSACIPEGIALAAMGADVGATGDTPDGGRSEASGDAEGAVDEPALDGRGDPGSPDGDAGDGSGSGLCTVGAVGATGPVSAALWLLPLLGWLRRLR